jgi:hypothetical protein
MVPSTKKDREYSNGYLRLAYEDDDKEGRRTVLLLGFEDDEEGSGFADNTEENGLAGFDFL